MLNSLVGIIASSGGAAGGGASYESIASTTLGADGTISFTSIPSTYASLQLRVLSRRTGTDSNAVTLSIRINNDSTASYAEHWIAGDGTTASATGSISNTSIQAMIVPRGTTNPTTYGTAIIDFNNYASTSQNKTIRSFAGTDSNGSGQVKLVSGLWINTTAINRIDIFSTMSSGSVASLYGIKGA